MHARAQQKIPPDTNDFTFKIAPDKNVGIPYITKTAE